MGKKQPKKPSKQRPKPKPRAKGSKKTAKKKSTKRAKKRRRNSDPSDLLRGSVRISKKGDQFIFTAEKHRKPKPTKLLKEVRARFAEASRWAVRQTADPEIKALYSARIDSQRHTAYLVAVADYLKAPRVPEIDTFDYRGRIGDTIRIKAIDDFMVTAVTVTITNAEGHTIENGDAIKHEMHLFFWNYIAKVANPNVEGTLITVVATDRPGNKTTGELQL
jgi:hypothetical protein